MVDREFAQYEIGVDTGLQRASAQPGFRGPDGQGGNVLNVDTAALAVTIGFGRSYSGHFDNLRPLLPADLPEPWRSECEQIITDWVEHIAEEEFNS